MLDDVLSAFRVFGYACVIDTLWVFWFLSVSRKSKPLAACMSMLMGLPAIEGYLAIFETHWLKAPYVLGLGAGTVIGLYVDDAIQKWRKAKNDVTADTGGV